MDLCLDLEVSMGNYSVLLGLSFNLDRGLHWGMSSSHIFFPKITLSTRVSFRRGTFIDNALYVYLYLCVYVHMYLYV